MDYTRVCFDSSVWNALVNREPHHDLTSIDGWITKIDSKKAKLLVPSIVIAELAAHPDKKLFDVFEAYLNKTQVEILDITTSIAKRAGQLRRRMKNERLLNIKLPDVLIVAAADCHRADLILSVDAGILRCDGQFELSPKIGRPNTGFNQPLLDNLV